MPHRQRLHRVLFPLLLCATISGGPTMIAGDHDTQANTDEKPSAIEYYYKVKWGYADEFIRLFRKNHYPVLKKQIEMGRIQSVTAVTPRFHNTEEGRWDYRVTITFKNSRIAFSDFDSEPINRELYPDQETFKREEQRRFEILLAHWDLPVSTLDLEKK
jgi:hypothetical protein